MLRTQKHTNGRILRIALICSLLLVGTAALRVHAVQTSAPGVDLVFLLDNRSDAWIDTSQKIDFTRLDPEGSRYEAIKLAGHYLAIDSLLFNPQNEHSLSVILFDGLIRPGNDGTGIYFDPITIAPKTEAEFDAINKQFLDQIRPPTEDDQICALNQPKHDGNRCGALYGQAFLRAQSILEPRSASNRKQIIVVLTVYGASSDQQRSYNATEHERDMNGMVDPTIKYMTGRGVEVHTFALNAQFSRPAPPTGNYFWETGTKDEWERFARNYGIEVMALPKPQDYIGRVRDIIRRSIVFEGVVQRDQSDLQTSMEFEVSPYASSLTIIYLKDQQGDSIRVDYADPDVPEAILKQKTFGGSGYFEVITIEDPPPGPYWKLRLGVPRGQISMLEAPARSSLNFANVQDGSTIKSLTAFHKAKIVFTPKGTPNTPLMYDNQAFNLTPVAVVSGGGSSWRVPLTLQRTEGEDRGKYTGVFFPVMAGAHQISIRFENPAAITGMLISPPDFAFEVTPVHYTFTAPPPTQFEGWNYAIRFVDSLGNAVKPSGFVTLPTVGVELKQEGKLVQLPISAMPAFDSSAEHYTAPYIFRKHGEFEISVAVSIIDVNGNRISIPSSQNSDLYTLKVAPAPLIIESDDTAREYDPVTVRFRPARISFAQFGEYGLNVDALIVPDGSTQPVGRVRLKAITDGVDVDYYVGQFYATREGKYHLKIEAYTDVSGEKETLVTSDQGEKIFTATPITIGFVDLKPASQFAEWNFTIALLSNGEPLTSDLAPDLKPEVRVKLGDVIIPFEQLQPVPDAISQWSGKFTFTVAGDLTAQITAFGQPPKTIGAENSPVTVDPQEPRGTPIRVTPIEVEFGTSLNEQLMLEPLTFRLNVPRIKDQNGNTLLRETYNMTVTFVVTAMDESGAVQTWRIPAEAVTSLDAPYIAQFIPTVPGEHTVIVEYGGKTPRGGKIELETPPLTFSTRPLTIAFEPLASPDWERDDQGAIKVEVERSLIFRAQFFDGNNVQRKAPALPVTVQADLSLPGGSAPRRLEFTRNDDNSYTLQTEPLNTPGAYKIALIAQTEDADGRSRRMPVAQNLKNGLSFEVINISEIKFALRDPRQREQRHNRLPIFAQDETILDISTLLEASDGSEATVDPKILFRSANPEQGATWFELTVDGEKIPTERISVSFPEQEFREGFRLQVRGLPLGEHDLVLTVSNMMKPRFGARLTGKSVFSGEKITISQNVLQPILFGIVGVILLIGLVRIGIARMRFQRENAIQEGVLVLEDEYHRRLWSHPLADGERRASRVFSKTEEHASGWGRAMLETITIENTPTFAAKQQLKATIVQTGGKPQELYLSLQTSDMRYQLQGARKGFYLRIETTNDTKGES